MKLLLNENLSHRIITDLEQTYPGSRQVSLLNLSEAIDQQIWDYAREHDYAIVTLDADFYDYSLVKGGPPLVRSIPDTSFTLYTTLSSHVG